MVADALTRASGRARRDPGAPTRWALRATAMLYLGLFVLLPVVVILQRGYSDGLTNLTDALDNFGAWNAIKLTVVMAFLAAIINGVFGTLLAYVLYRVELAGKRLDADLRELREALQ